MDQESFDKAVKETVDIAKDLFDIPPREPDLITKDFEAEEPDESFMKGYRR